VAEGPYQGQTGSVRAKSSTESYLGPMTHSGAASVIFEKGKQKLQYGTKTGVSAFTDPSNPVPTGTYDLQIPDAPHSGGAHYLSSSSYAKTWFRVGTSGDRYLHPGRVSAGCITVNALSEWTSIYNYLIKSRKSNTAVGRVEVKA